MRYPGGRRGPVPQVPAQRSPETQAERQELLARLLDERFPGMTRTPTTTTKDPHHEDHRTPR